MLECMSSLNLGMSLTSASSTPYVAARERPVWKIWMPSYVSVVPCVGPQTSFSITPLRERHRATGPEFPVGVVAALVVACIKGLRATHGVEASLELLRVRREDHQAQPAGARPEARWLLVRHQARQVGAVATGAVGQPVIVRRVAQHRERLRVVRLVRLLGHERQAVEEDVRGLLLELDVPRQALPLQIGVGKAVLRDHLLKLLLGHPQEEREPLVVARGVQHADAIADGGHAANGVARQLLVDVRASREEDAVFLTGGADGALDAGGQIRAEPPFPRGQS